MEERSASDEENFKNESSPEEDEDVDGVEVSSDDELDYSSDDASDLDERYLDASNKSTTSINTTESENTTHSYSNSLLESEDDEADAIAESDRSPRRKEYETPNLSDLNNGQC